MIMLRLVLLLLLITTNEGNNCNNYNNNNVVRLKVAIHFIRLISYSVKKMLLNSMFISVKIIC